ncbi:hypothetical protein LPW26_17180 [Rhodopseudomonas sp. HC1]|uniref:hypothetical protein n=1 Tax=Rhodopseudomonas infernalis TaxID=2897386 RepID=UPI001EE7A281|nr:hypothetical protein [Rhodopseudomonas infernalis]MCG6206385.1 hypothetical protein [Rhodopseudomonas infernalis]
MTIGKIIAVIDDDANVPIAIGARGEDCGALRSPAKPFHAQTPIGRIDRLMTTSRGGAG